MNLGQVLNGLKKYERPIKGGQSVSLKQAWESAEWASKSLSELYVRVERKKSILNSEAE